MSRLAVLVLISTAILLMVDYIWRVTSISLRKVLPIAFPLWLALLAFIWYWMA